MIAPCVKVPAGGLPTLLASFSVRDMALICQAC